MLQCSKTRIRQAAYQPGRLMAPALLFAVSLAVAIAAAAPATAAEQSLLGIRIYSPAKAILQKYGNPSEVQPGAQSISSVGGTMGPGAGARGGMGMGAPSFSFGGPSGIAPLPRVGGAPGSMPGEFGGGGNTSYSFGGMQPPQPTFGPMGPRGPMGSGAPSTTTGEGSTYESQEVWYIYEKPNGMTYEFLLSPQGRVIEIAVAGYKGGGTTSRGITLGSTYAQVLAKYGFPETQTVENGVVFLSYTHRAHVAFQLMDNKVVSIIVAYMKA